jgi:SAM-dependent methyltransferase
MANDDSYLQAELEKIYSHRFDSDEKYRNEVWRTLIRHWFQDYVPADSTVLDLGCGYGQFINNIQCAKKYAMDLNPAARGRLEPAVEFLEQNCAATWNLPGDSLDLVFTSNFFEHLPSKEDLARTIAEARRCLKKGGRLIAMGPNIKFVKGAYWDFFDHHLALTELSMKEAFEVAGLTTEYVRDRFLPYTMVNAPQYPVVLLRIYLGLPLAWKLFGQQFVVMAVK